jgi:cytochrome c biogenesis protein CcdA
VIRMFVAGLGAVALFGSLFILWRQPLAWLAALELDVLGLLILGSLAFERRYRSRRQNDTQWQKTGERFVDPTSGKLTEVRYNSQTGERAYTPVEG